MGWRAAHLLGLIGNSTAETPATSWVNVVFERMPLIHPAFMAIWNHNSTRAVERLYWIRMKGKMEVTNTLETIMWPWERGKPKGNE